jgi:hypothetical protein
MTFTRPTSPPGTPPPRTRQPLRDRIAVRFLARTLATLTPDQRVAVEERIALGIFDANLAESDAIRIALAGHLAQQPARRTP